MRDPAHERPPEHVAAFYRTDAFLADHVATFVAEGLAAREQVVVLATIPHWNVIAVRLDARGIAHGRAAADGRLVLLDAESVLDSTTVDGRVDPDRFRVLLGPFVASGHRTRIYGELVSLLVDRGEVETALAIEALGHQLSHRSGIRILCAYAEGDPGLLPGDAERLAAAHDRSLHEHALIRLPAAPAVTTHPYHAVQFYESATSLAVVVGRFLADGFVTGAPAIVVATPEHRAAIEEELAARLFDPALLIRSGHLVMVNAGATLAELMLDGVPDPTRFRRVIEPLLARAARERPGPIVRIYGELVDLLWKDGRTAAAIRLEMLWNELADTHAFALLCGYSAQNVYTGAAQQQICAQHAYTVGG